MLFSKVSYFPNVNESHHVFLQIHQAASLSCGQLRKLHFHTIVQPIKYWSSTSKLLLNIGKHIWCALNVVFKDGGVLWSPLVLKKIGPSRQDFYLASLVMYFIFDNIYSTLPHGQDSAV